MLRPLAAACAGLVVAGLLAACDDGGKKSDEASYAIGKGDEYVALGDSYTAAPGTGTVTKGGGCSQTEVNYPHRIAQATGVSLRDNSCNGASTDDVEQPQATPKGLQVNDAQLDGLSDDTDLVTFRLGANDFSLIARVFLCAAADARGTLGGGTEPCTDLDRTSPQGAADEVLPQLESKVEAALQAVSDRAPNARIFVIGYPQILPPEGSCDLFPLPPGDEAWAHRILDGLNDALRAGAEAIDAPYIDMTEVSAGHDTCSDEPWMAGIEPVPGAAVAFHPFTAEGQAVARLVLAQLERP
ncbi:SGNH/GDSL hydrolase family protein [Nocardioides sp. MH1]|uniref:SGNH/GDSL hydrolase family protein n=1 Tax=Nocardioides sp. MH1 TaxID=3242490 RepID=UPI00352310D0